MKKRKHKKKNINDMTFEEINRARYRELIRTGEISPAQARTLVEMEMFNKVAIVFDYVDSNDKPSMERLRGFTYRLFADERNRREDSEPSLMLEEGEHSVFSFVGMRVLLHDDGSVVEDDCMSGVLLTEKRLIIFDSYCTDLKALYDPDIDPNHIVTTYQADIGAITRIELLHAAPSIPYGAVAVSIGTPARLFDVWDELRSAAEQSGPQSQELLELVNSNHKADREKGAFPKTLTWILANRTERVRENVLALFEDIQALAERHGFEAIDSDSDAGSLQ